MEAVNAQIRHLAERLDSLSQQAAAGAAEHQAIHPVISQHTQQLAEVYPVVTQHTQQVNALTARIMALEAEAVSRASTGAGTNDGMRRRLDRMTEGNGSVPV